jgi:transcriptional regulator with XRE-family HTH domain
LAVAERHREWIELRRAGISEQEIARRYGVTQQAVSKILLKYVRNLSAPAADDLRKLESERLDHLWAALVPGIGVGDPRAILAAVKVSERRSKLLGLDLVNAHDASQVDNGSVHLSVVNLLASSETIDPEVLRQIQVADPIIRPDDADDGCGLSAE